MNFKRAAFVALTALSAACGSIGTSGAAEERWTIVDRETKRPIPNAWVTVHFNEDVTQFFITRTICVATKTLIADENGQVHFAPGPRGSSPTIIPRKEGFHGPVGVREDAQRREVYLVPIERTGGDPYQTALQGAIRSACYQAEMDKMELARRKHFLLVARRLADANNKAQMDALDNFAQQIERDERELAGAK
jgi:hypothetical protein